MAHQFLDDAYIDAVFQQVSCKTVPEGMAGHPFGYSGSLDGGFVVVVQKRSVIPTFFSTTTYAAIPYFET